MVFKNVTDYEDSCARVNLLRLLNVFKYILKLVKILKQTKDQLFSLDGLYFYRCIVFKYF